MFNSLTTVHALIMMFGAIMPAFVGFANWLIPMQIGAADMAFARMNNWSFWIMIPAAVAAHRRRSSCRAALPPRAGRSTRRWSRRAAIGTDMTILAMHIMGASSIMGSINIITTILNLRAPGMTMMKMPLFCWTWLITAYLLIATMPVLAGAVTMLLTDRHFGTSFFNAAGGGDPTMFMHIFWFFGQPEVYILILRAIGIVSQIILAFASKPLFGYASMVYATASIAILVVHRVGPPHVHRRHAARRRAVLHVRHHADRDADRRENVQLDSPRCGADRLRFETPMLFALGFVCMFTIGGFSGLMLAHRRGRYHLA